MQLWNHIVDDFKSLKYHVFGLLSVLVKYVAPVLFVLGKSMATKETRNTPAVWGVIVLSILVTIYFFTIRRWITNAKTEERLVKRINVQNLKPIRYLIFIFIDDVIVMPIVPFAIWLLTDLLQKMAVNISLSFLVVGILFVIGGFLKLIDAVIELNRLYEKGSAN